MTLLSSSSLRSTSSRIWRILARVAGLNFAALSLFGQSNGIYESSPDGKGPRIITQDGVEARLESRAPVRIRESFLYSQNNENSEFYLSIQASDPDSVNLLFPPRILWVDGTAYRQRSGGSGPDGLHVLGFNVRELAKARQIAAYLQASLRLRESPPHALSVVFKPTKLAFTPRETIRATMKVTNNGSTAVAFKYYGGISRHGNPFDFSIHTRTRDINIPFKAFCYDCIDTTLVLNPGETMDRDISLSQYYPFATPGYYRVRGSFFLDMRTVANPHESFSVWQDSVSANFQVIVR